MLQETVCDVAGMYYGAKSFAGGARGAASALDEMHSDWYYSRRGYVVEDSMIENVTYEGMLPVLFLSRKYSMPSNNSKYSEELR